jgi:hypothetical protein
MRYLRREPRKLSIEKLAISSPGTQPVALRRVR